MDSNLEEEPWYKDIADRYRFNIDDLKSIDSLDEPTMGYCVLCGENEYAHAYKDKVLIAEGGDFYIYRFIMLRLFLDKYRRGKYELPKLDETRLVGQSKEAAIQWNHTAMEIMLRPLNTYGDLLARFDETKKELALDPKKVETFNDYESQGKTLNGTYPSWERDDYRVYKPVDEGVWDVSYAVERGNGRLKFMLRIYGAKNLYEYILNNHLSAVL